MPEGMANTPWWVVLGIVVAVVTALIRGALWAGSVNTRLDSLSKTVSDGFAEVRADLKKILERQSPPPAVEERSPIQFTGFGRELSATGSAGAWALTNASNLEAEAAGK